MARESRRTREARRFGEPTRLADMILDTSRPDGRYSWSCPSYCDPAKDRSKNFRGLTEVVAKAKVFDFSNIAEYVHDNENLHHSEVDKVGQISVPYETFFAEAEVPRSVHVNHGWHPQIPTYYGAFVTTRPYLSGSSSHITENETFQQWIREEYPSFVPDDKTLILTLGLVVGMKNVQTVFGPLGSCILLLDGNRSVLTKMATCIFESEKLSASNLEASRVCYSTYAYTFVYAMSVLGAHGTRTVEFSEGREFDRERKKAGMKPFVRYSRIVIDPGSNRRGGTPSENPQHGNVGLHFCRGHFKTFTEDRKMFGRLAGKFWVPAHVKGNPEKGQIVSDYTVNKPK